MSCQWARVRELKGCRDILPVPQGHLDPVRFTYLASGQLLGTGLGMTHADINLKDDPEYLTLSRRGKNVG